MASTVPPPDQTAALGASARATIAADPTFLWAWIADPTRHPILAGSGEPQSIQMLDGAEPSLGARFEAQQKVFGVVRYVAVSEIVAFEPNRRFRFLVGGRSYWEFELTPVAGGTRVTHRHRVTFPGGPLRLLRPFLQQRIRMNANNMARTLQNLARLVGAPPPADIQVSYTVPELA